MDLKVTKYQLDRIIDLTNTMEAMLGTLDGDFNKEGSKCIRAVDRMLKKNGLIRL